MDALVGTILGWVGTLGTFSAYVLMMRGTWLPSTRAYLAFNAVGGLLAAAGALAFGAWPSVASNVVWGVMGAYGLYTTYRRRSLSGAEAAVPVVTMPIPILPMQQSPWDPSSTAAAPISLPWLPRADGATSALSAADGATVTDLGDWRDATAAIRTA